MSKGKPSWIHMHEEKNQLSHHRITMLTSQLLDTQQPVNHRSHQGETHQSTKKVTSGQNTSSQPQKSYVGKTHPVNHESYIWAKHTQSTMKAVSGQSTPSQPWKSCVGKTYPVNHGSYIWTKHTQSNHENHIWANHTQSTMKIISGQITPSQPWKLYLGKTHTIYHRSCMCTKVTSGQITPSQPLNSPNQPWKSYQGKIHLVNH